MGRTSFAAFVDDQLRGLGRVDTRPMFGGFGLYLGEVFFGILFKERLYFKTNDATREAYRRAGMKPFQPNPRQTLVSYFEVPADVLEERDALQRWARQAVDCQVSALRQSKPGRAGR